MLDSSIPRAKAIVNSDYIRNHDVIVLEGCMSINNCEVVRKGLQGQYPYQTPIVGDTSGNKGEWDAVQDASMSGIDNGGVLIVSK